MLVKVLSYFVFYLLDAIMLAMFLRFFPGFR